jgi:hypothetical protein
VRFEVNLQYGMDDDELVQSGCSYRDLNVSRSSFLLTRLLMAVFRSQQATGCYS